MTSGVSSVSESEFITYLVPNICTNCSKNLHSCLSPLKTSKKWPIIQSKNTKEDKSHTKDSVLTVVPLGTVWSLPSAFLPWTDTVQESAGSPGWPWPEISAYRCSCSCCHPSDSLGSQRSPKFPAGPQSLRPPRPSWSCLPASGYLRLLGRRKHVENTAYLTVIWWNMQTFYLETIKWRSRFLRNKNETSLHK